MNYIRIHKKKVLLYMLLFIGLLLTFKLLFFQLDNTSVVGRTIFMYAIAFFSVLSLLIYIVPTKISIKEFIHRYRDVILFDGFILITEFIFLIDNQLEATTVTLFTLAFIISIYDLIILIAPNKVKTIITFILAPLITLYTIFQDVYYAIFSDMASVKESVSAKEGIEFSNGVVRFELIHGVYILLCILFIFLFLRWKQNNRIKLSKKNLKVIFAPAFIFVLVNFNAYYPVNTARLHLSDHYLYESVYNRKMFVSRFGIDNFLFRDLVDAAIPNLPNKHDVKEINTYFEEHPKNHEVNDHTGIFENKNFVFIVAESFDSMAINETLTPNIVKMMNEGITLDNHYVPVYPRTTCDSEIIYNTGLIPSITDGPTCYMYNENSYTDSLANAFKEKGYVADAFHGNSKEFYTRYKVYNGLGYDHFYGQDEIGLNDENKHFDSIFFEEAKDLIIKKDERFFSSITTLSGHSPYGKDNPVVQAHIDEVNKVYGDSVPGEIKDYMAAQIELDQLVGEVFDDLEAKGLLENTVVILTPDHFPYTLPAETYSSYKGIDDLYLKSKAPFIIWADGLQHESVTKLSSSFDVLPTIANLFNLDVNYNYYFGSDVFSNNHQEVVYYKDYSWFDGTNYVSEGLVRNNGNGSLAYIDETTNEVNKYFEISKKILRTDYFKEPR